MKTNIRVRVSIGFISFYFVLFRFYLLLFGFIWFYWLAEAGLENDKANIERIEVTR
jgi:hypothetical protein